MSMRWNGSVLGRDDRPLTDNAVGVWRLRDHANYQRTNEWVLASPTDISGCVVWFDFSDSSKVFDADTGGSTPASGGAIGRIEDKSGNARNATQATANNRPTYQTNVQNGLAVARFDGSNDTLNTANFAMAANITWFAVAARDWSTAGYRAIFGSTNYATTAGYAVLTSGGVSGTNQWKSKDLLCVGNGFEQAPLRTSAYGGSVLLNSFTTNSFHLFSGTLGGVANRFYIDRSEAVYSYAVVDEDLTCNTTSTAFRVGSTPLDLWNRDVAEVIVYNSVLSDNNRRRVENYLTRKWALP